MDDGGGVGMAKKDGDGLSAAVEMGEGLESGGAMVVAAATVTDMVVRGCGRNEETRLS